MNEDRMTPEALAEIEGLAEYACEDPDDMDRLATEAVPQMAAEIRRAWAELAAREADDAKVGKWPVHIPGSTFHGAKIIAADYENREITLNWSENGGSHE